MNACACTGRCRTAPYTCSGEPAPLPMSVLDAAKSNVIDKFDGDYRFLSNFFVVPRIDWEGLHFTTTEAAYQASKCKNQSDKIKFTQLTPSATKMLGREVEIREDWDQIKLYVMEQLLRQKFRSGRLRTLLTYTGDKELIEGNWWNDTFWGVCKGVGENHLGKLLMKIRQEINDERRDADNGRS